MLSETGEVMGVLLLEYGMDWLNLVPKIRQRASAIHDHQWIGYINLRKGIDSLTGEYELSGGQIKEFSITETEIL